MSGGRFTGVTSSGLISTVVTSIVHNKGFNRGSQSHCERVGCVASQDAGGISGGNTFSRNVSDVSFGTEAGCRFIGECGILLPLN